MEYTKEFVKKLLAHLEKTNQAWCFDEFGIVWTRESASLFLLNPELNYLLAYHLATIVYILL